MPIGSAFVDSNNAIALSQENTMATDCCGPSHYYICESCVELHFPDKTFQPFADNEVGRKCCHWCGDNAPSHFDIVHC